MSDYGKYQIVARHSGETVSLSCYAHYAVYGLLWVRFFKKSYQLFSSDTEVARFRRSSVITVSKEVK